MTDQTRWGIDMVQQENKAKVHEEQKAMRDEVAFFVLNSILPPMPSRSCEGISVL